MSATRKVVINKCFGGFGLSDAAYLKLSEWYGVPIKKYGAEEGEVIFDRELTGPDENTLSAIYHQFKEHGVQQRYWTAWDMPRDDARLIRLVEEMGTAANGMHAKLAIVDVPDGVEWEIDEYDGKEHIAEVHRTWR
jgi:hypothetical protein